MGTLISASRFIEHVHDSARHGVANKDSNIGPKSIDFIWSLLVKSPSDSVLSLRD